MSGSLREGDREEEVICGLSDMPCGGREAGRRRLSVVSRTCRVEGGRQGGGGYLWSLRYAVWREGGREEGVICGLSDVPCGGREAGRRRLSAVSRTCRVEGGRQGGGGYLRSLGHAVWREGGREEEVICGLSDMPCRGREAGRRRLSAVSRTCRVEGGRQGGGGFLRSLGRAVWRKGGREEEVFCGLSDMPCGGREAGRRRFSAVSRTCRVEGGREGGREEEVISGLSDMPCVRPFCQSQE